MFLVLLISLVLLLGSVLSYSLATALLVRLVVRLKPIASAGLGFSRNVGVMMLVTFLTAGVHLIQIGLWALAFVLCGEMTSFERAFYFSAETYTALGYGDIVLSERWRLLGPLEAINGLLLFGLSTAMMFAALSRLITNEIRFHRGQRHEPGGIGSKGTEEENEGPDG
jgi:hypothetical protein